MFLADFHIHSVISEDSDTPRAEMAAAAINAGLQAVCFTDHYDVVGFDGSYIPFFDWIPVRKEQQKALAACGDQIEIYYGLELGNVNIDHAAGDRVLLENDLDFVLGSIHNLSYGEHTDFYYVSYNSPELCYSHLDDYFASMLDIVQWGKFDILAHIPYPLRYMSTRDGQTVSLERYQKQLERILEIAVERGIGIEVNTKGWNQQFIEEYTRIVKTYLRLGGDRITIGSDAHDPASVGNNIAAAARLLRDCGTDHYVIYKKRIPVSVSLEDI